MRYKSLPRFLRHFFPPPPHSPVSDGSVKGTARAPQPLPQTRRISIFCPRNESAPDGAGAEPGPRSEPRTRGLREAPGSFPTPGNRAGTAGTAVPGVGVCYGGLSSLRFPSSSPLLATKPGTLPLVQSAGSRGRHKRTELLFWVYFNRVIG